MKTLWSRLVLCVGLVAVTTGPVQTAGWNSHSQPVRALALAPGCALPLDRPLRAIHIAGNWGTSRPTVEAWDTDDDESLIPSDYIEYLQGLNVNWVGISVALHYDDSMDSTVERAYSSSLNIPTFSDDVLRQLIREFRENGFDVYLTLAFESIEAQTAERPVERWQLGDFDPNTGVPHPNRSQIVPEFWPWRPSHPDHNRFVAEFWDTYTQQAVHFAEIAQDEGVRMYSLGTETDRLFRTRHAEDDYFTNDFDAELRSMVSSVRAVYDGLLTYDMHHSSIMYTITHASHYGLGWRYLWEDLDLDVVGISAWFSLTESTPSEVMSVESLSEAYEKIFDDYLVPIETLNTGRQIVFTEYGAMDLVRTPENPGDATGQYTLMEYVDANENGVDDGRETQANMFQALFNTIDQYPGLVHGAFFWDNWIASNALWAEELLEDRRNFDIRNKPSGEVVRTAYDCYRQR